MIEKTILNDEEYLRQISRPIDFNQSNYLEMIKNLEEYCHQKKLIFALATVQIGIPYRFIYLKVTNVDHLEDSEYDEHKILINPTIKDRRGITIFWEACVSCMDNFGLIRRPYSILVEYYDINQNCHEEWFEGFPATVISHEYDHLNGILHMDIADQLLIMNQEERKKFREKEENKYTIISKDGIYPYKEIYQEKN